ncbi:diaminopimelate decarboxylase [Pigmentiphaga aceris]|uniref:Diaminopimelate decarboxylase n=1 Tax=Pigmentiphaga aceris TaxID=1940612 RepID=A0A5C0ATX7_9BURK|nr:diaminopimelate decarboxylase [Pigmentiphaga aceris]QEI04430.1 diaminopimelate decarboxylase [Pigmentiphaga aceris]
MQITDDLFTAIAHEHGTPVWVYDAQKIRARIALLQDFDLIRYAQKANANIHLLRLMREAGVRVDAVSHGELVRSLAAEFTPQEVVFTADLIDDQTRALVMHHGIAVNCGSVDMIDALGAHAPGHAVWLRINPGFGHGHSPKTNTGGVHSKHGVWIDDVPQALAAIRRHGLRLVGLHMHIGSGTDYAHLAQVCDAMVAAIVRFGIDVDAISAGGGLPDDDDAAQIGRYFALWDAARQRIAARLGHAVTLEVEPGRFLVASSGVLLTQVHVVKDTPAHRFVLVDAGFNDLVRPAFYGSRHPISVVSADTGQRAPRDVVVAGPLCEAGDVFTQSREGVLAPCSLPDPRVGDLLVLHEAGAYGASMSSTYNSRPLAPEVLVDGTGHQCIRHRQRIDALIALEIPVPTLHCNTAPR